MLDEMNGEQKNDNEKREGMLLTCRGAALLADRRVDRKMQ